MLRENKNKFDYDEAKIFLAVYVNLYITGLLPTALNWLKCIKWHYIRVNGSGNIGYINYILNDLYFMAKQRLRIQLIVYKFLYVTFCVKITALLLNHFGC